METFSLSSTACSYVPDCFMCASYPVGNRDALNDDNPRCQGCATM